MPAADPYSPADSSPCTNGEVIAKSDTVEFTNVSRAIYVGGAGDVVAIMSSGTSLTFLGVPAGTILPIRAKRIHSTDTTATSMIALY